MVNALSIFSGKSNDLYAVLGVPKSSSQGEIKKAFRRLTKANHPDLKETSEEKEEAKKKLIPILAAYEILSNEERREEYDSTGVMFSSKTPPPEDFTTIEELFRYYNVSPPIVSKTPTMESSRTLQKILNYRGPKLFLIQVFRDDMSVSRAFSIVWESVARSPLVVAGLVELYRIDADSFAGAPLAEKLKVHLQSSSKEIPLFAILDGERWEFVFDSSKHDVPIEEEVVEFLHRFFRDTAKEVENGSVYYHTALEERVALPMQECCPTRLLMPSTVTEGMLTAVHLRFPQVELISAPRTALRQFIEVDCGRSLEMEGHFGEVISAPDFLVALTSPVLRLPFNHTAANATTTPSVSESQFRSRSTDSQHPALWSSNTSSMPDRCPSIEVGLSIFLTYNKVVKFLQDVLPPEHPEMGPITPVNNMNFMRFCEGDCLLYFRPHCDNVSTVDGIPSPTKETAAASSVRNGQEAPHITAKAVELLNRPYPDIQVGYICVDAHPRLQRAISASIPHHHPLAVPGNAEEERKKTMEEPFLALLLHGDDTRVFPILSSDSISSSSSASSSPPHVMTLTPSIIDTAIAKLLLADVDEEVDKMNAGASTPNPAFLHVISLKDTNGSSVGVGNLLHTTPFPFSSNQRYSILSSRFLAQLRPFFFNSLPFFLMFLTHKFWFNRKPTAKPVNRTGKKMGAIFDEDDLDNALEGSGFLILVADKRPVGSGPLTLPSIASDSRFVVRALGPEHTKWKNWMEREKKKLAASGASLPQKKEANKGENASDEAGSTNVERNPHADLSILAIRQTKMTSAAKSDTQSVESFLYDLLDGTIPTTSSVPYTALL